MRNQFHLISHPFKKTMHQVYLLTGSNIGDRKKHLQHAIQQLNIVAGEVISTSSVYETAPWGVTDQDAYLNQAILLQTNLLPAELFSALKKIEENEGRTSQIKYAPRTLDIDILFYDDLILETEVLTIPHPRLHLRKFVLVPMNEIAAEFFHPILKKKIKMLLKNCEDELAVIKIS